MKCSACLKVMPEILEAHVRDGVEIHCPYCTTKLEIKDDLLDVDPEGTWYVETEADVEGKGRRRVGVYRGHLADVIARTSSHAMYSLYIRKIEPTMVSDQKKPGDAVSVHLEGRNGETNERLLRSYLEPSGISVDGIHVTYVTD